MTEGKLIYRKDYQKPAYKINTTDLDFTLHPTKTRVLSRLKGEKTVAGPIELLLNGKFFELVKISLNGRELSEKDYVKTTDSLTLTIQTDRFEIECETLVNPQANTFLSGLYLSNGVFCTQCEAEGFRNITYYPDHPDIMSRFTTTIRADRKKYPVLLSNGNKIKDDGDVVVWEDPFLKPSYLFALVAGDLGVIEDSFVTCSGRKVDLRLYCEKGKENRLTYAMASLKRAMKWDEEAFGREYDLNLFNIVAVSDFNAGAMENKSLNIFNDSCLLASMETETDREFEFIESVVGHEYFHNWSGDRVTAQDWFNLSLKEGFTVYRDQEFSSDQRSRPVKRIDDVITLRLAQFPEDDGPLAHPVRPESYMTIDNFYTATVYDKGAELIRMQEKIVGKEGFRKGCDLYFDTYDGQAVTIDDFAGCIAKANNIDLTQFMRWYSVAGRPVVHVETDYNEEKKTLTLSLSQKTKNATEPFLIPLAYGLLDKNGQEISKGLLLLKENKQTFVLENIPSYPVLSLNRSFTAPVDIDYTYTPEEYLLLMQHDTDLFNRYESGQQYALNVMLQMLKKNDFTVDDAFLSALYSYLKEAQRDPAFTAKALILPAETTLIEKSKPADVFAVHKVREAVRTAFAQKYQPQLSSLYEKLSEEIDSKATDAVSVGKRALKNALLGYLTLTDEGKTAYKQYTQAKNMTDKLSALSFLMNTNSSFAATASDDFYETYKNDHLIVNKWLMLEGSALRKDGLEKVKRLLTHPAFDIKNPNKVRALIGCFSRNTLAFHALNGSGYAFLAEQVLKVDKLNPQSAQRLVIPLTQGEKFDEKRRLLMTDLLKKINASEGISVNLKETVSKALLES
jgi:aminopeptidase N